MMRCRSPGPFVRHGLTTARVPRNLVKRTDVQTQRAVAAPNTPVEITSAAVSEGMPPSFSATTMAMSVGTDFGASDASV